VSSNQQLLLGEGAGSAPAVYVEDVFSTYLYTGNGSTQTITNGIDLSTKGGLVWIKSRTTGFNHTLVDTVRGATNLLVSNTTAAQATQANSLTAFTSTGFSIGAGSIVNYATDAFVSWTFRKQPKFFDVVTYTGDGDYSATRLIAHNLGSAVGAIIVKPVSATGDWKYTHRNGSVLLLNSTEPENTAITLANGFPAANSTTTFALVPYSGSGSAINASGVTYVAYLFAHNAGGFGLAGTDNVISCGSYTGSSSPFPVITLGYEPQWVLIKRTDSGSANDWMLFDNMRGFGFDSVAGFNLKPNLSDAEQNSYTITPTATGFSPTTNGAQTNGAGATYIYIAIRRGPMKVPTVGTSVYDAEAFTGTGATRAITTLSAPDMAWILSYKNFTSSNTTQVYDRLRGNGVRLRTGLTNADNTNAVFLQFNNQMLATVGNDSETNGSGALNVAWAFKRAPGFFDVVCDTGTGAAHTITHNLGVPAELLIRKMRSGLSNWWCYNSIVGGTKSIKLNDSGTYNTSIVYWNDTDSTSTTFSVGTTAEVNQSGSTFVTYLFATCAGVSKVGTYTGNGSSQTIACGFAAGSRFVLIKRTDSTGDWYVWNSASGIIAGNDPHVSLNSTAAEVTTDDSVDTDNSGFIVNQDAATNVNVTSATYIFLAIA